VVFEAGVVATLFPPPALSILSTNLRDGGTAVMAESTAANECAAAKLSGRRTGTAVRFHAVLIDPLLAAVRVALRVPAPVGAALLGGSQP